MDKVPQIKLLRSNIEKLEKLLDDLIDNVDISPKSRWPLDSNAPYMKGPGLKL